MNPKLIRFVIFTLVALILGSCATTHVQFYGKDTKKVESIALISTLIGRLKQPTFPLIDAALLNDKTNLIAYNIMEDQKKQVDKCRDTVAEQLKTHFGSEVLFGETLQNVEGFESLKTKYNFSGSLRTNNDNFPTVILSTGDINPFEYKLGNVKAYMTRENKAYREAAAAICQELNVDIVAVSYSQITIKKVGMFGGSAMLALDTFIYMFDRNGILVSQGNTSTELVQVSGDNAADYRRPYSMFPASVNGLIGKMAQKFTKV